MTSPSAVTLGPRGAGRNRLGVSPHVVTLRESLRAALKELRELRLDYRHNVGGDAARLLARAVGCSRDAVKDVR